MGSLPPLLALSKEYGKPIKKEYLEYETKGSRRGCIKLSSEAGALTPTANFAVEPAKGGLVHIRSTYNYNYLCRESPESWSIAAVANEPVEDRSKWNCTLFRPQMTDDELLVSFFQIGTGDTEYGLLVGSENVLQIHPTSGGTKDYSFFNIVNVGSKVRLPKRIAFKGDNGMYLKVLLHENQPYNAFVSENKSDISAHYETFTTKDGDIRVKSLQFDKFWRCSSHGWILADTNDNSTNDPNTLFEVVKVGDNNVIALRNQGNKCFCKRLTMNDVGKHLLNAAAINSVDICGRLIVEEPVFERKIQIQFRFDDARIYDKKSIQVATVIVLNGTNQTHKLTQGLWYTQTHIGSWSTTTTTRFKIGTTKATISSGIPFFTNGQFKVSGDVSDLVTMGESTNFSKLVTSNYDVSVPPMTRATITLLASEAKYDIPYSYYQIDSYNIGEQETTLMEDGIYHGVQSFDFLCESKYEPIPAPQVGPIVLSY